MAPISSTCACRHVSWRKRGAKHRITAAKQAGRRSMVAVLWPGRASLADHPLRRPTLQVRTALTPCRTGQSRAELVSRYLERHAGRNELARRTASLPAGSVVTDTCIMPKAEFRRTEFYGECLGP